MTSPFVARCRETARNLRRMPAEVRRELAQRVRPDVADPLAGDIRSTFTGPWAAQLSAATKTRVQAETKIVIGGARRVVSGGASARDLVFGDQFGGGKKVAQVSRRTRRGSVSYRRHTTRQFAKAKRDTVFPTIGRTMPDTLDRFARIVMEVLTRGI